MPNAEITTFLRRSLLFLAGLLLVTVLAEMRLRQNIRTHEAAHYAELFSGSTQAGVVIFGSSTGVHGIQPSLFTPLEGTAFSGEKIFNFSLMGAVPVFQYEWYHELFSRYYPKPKLAIVTVDWFGFDDTAVEEDSRKHIEHDARYLAPPAFLQLLFSRDTQHRTLLLNALALYNSHRNLLHVFFPQKQWGAMRMDRIEAGYLPRTDTITEIVPEQRRERWDPLSVAAFENLLRDLQADGIQVVLIQTPNFTPGYTKEVESAVQIQKVADRFGIPYLDYNGALQSALNKDPSAFADMGHLNTTGATLFSRMLKRDLAKVL